MINYFFSLRAQLDLLVQLVNVVHLAHRWVSLGLNSHSSAIEKNTHDNFMEPQAKSSIQFNI